MSTQTLQMDVFAFCDQADQTKNDHTSPVVTFDYTDFLFCKFSAIGNYSWKYNRISHVSADFYVASIIEVSSYGGDCMLRGGVMDKDYDVNTMTFSNKPSRPTASVSSKFTTAGHVTLDLLSSPRYSNRLVFLYGVEVSNYYGKFSAHTPAGTYKPKLILTIDDSDIVKMYANTWASNFGGKTISKTAGADIELSVPTTQSGLCYAEVYQTGISVIWRDVGSTSDQEIQMANGAAQQLVIPAGTFSGKSQVQIRPKITSNNGQTSTADAWLTIILQDEKSTAVPISPVNDIIDKNADAVFRWAHVITTGTPQTKAELQISDNGTVWTALATVTGADTYYTVAAGSIETGTHFWRVRTYNGDGVASDWSSAAEFICVGTPDAPVVLVQSSTPRPSVSWQTTEQQAYQVEIDGVYASGTRFGTGKTWKAPFYLADGSYTVRVRVQNEYGFWSPWGTAAFPVTNVPGGTIRLTAEGGIEAALRWTPGSFDYYLVYRNGVAIAKVTEPSYTDAASIGGVRYQVRGCYDNSDNYSLSEAVEVTVSTDNVRLYDMERGEWLHFLYDSSAHRSTGLNLSHDIQYVQLSGHTYPVAERSEFKSRALQITCVCADDAERQSLRALLGHMTCCKTPEGNMTIGYPASISESSDDFFSTYSFTIEQIDRKEEIDLDS
jgi:hypothetical protein|nr:MAG TPA: Oligo alginate lyase [Caudoviricetes sp.]